MGTSNCGMFSNPANTKKEAEIGGQFSTWKTVCTDPYIVCNLENQICNPAEYLDRTDNAGRIKRCIGGTQDIQCRVNGKLPSTDQVDKVLAEQSYDNTPYGMCACTGGFRNALEGF